MPRSVALACLLALSYVVSATFHGGVGALCVAALMAVGPLIFIAFGAQAGEALSESPESTRSRRFTIGTAIQLAGWALLVAAVGGYWAVRLRGG